MAEYTLELRDESGYSEFTTLEAEGPEAAAERAYATLEGWIRGGDWGDAGACVGAGWLLYDVDAEEGDDPIDTGSMEVAIEPDHRALIRRAGGDPDCDHEWVSTARIDGGLRENPGVFSAGGTTMILSDHCRLCGLRRTRTHLGRQRNPGEADTVRYQQPGSWCPSCEAEHEPCAED
jgi:hypothetical protein